MKRARVQQPGLRSTLRNVDCSQEKLRDACAYLRHRTLTDAERLIDQILTKRARLPHRGLQRMIRQQWSHPIKPLEALRSLLQSVQGNPRFDPYRPYLIDRLHYDSDPIIHRSFARAQGRTSAKNRCRFTIHLRIVPKVIVETEKPEQPATESQSADQSTRMSRARGLRRRRGAIEQSNTTNE